MLKPSIRYFASVVEHGSIRAAADALHIAQSAVSRQLQALEHELGATLLERRSRGIVLTEAGEILLSYINKTESSITRIRSEIDALQGLRRGHVRFATVESLVSEIIPLALKRFQERHPEIIFSVVAADSDFVLQTVKCEEADFGICFNQPIPPELEVVHRHKAPILAAMSQDHPLAHSAHLSVADLASWPVGVAPRWTGMRQLTDAAIIRAGAKLRPVLETNSVELLRRFASSGQGIAFLPKLACAQCVSEPELIAVPVLDREFHDSAFQVIKLAGRHSPVAVAAFLASLCATLDESRFAT